MFNPADFDALRVAIERSGNNESEIKARLKALHIVRQNAAYFGLTMAAEPAPVQLCQECGAVPVNGYFSRLCEACYAIACEEIRAELAQEKAADMSEMIAEREKERWFEGPEIFDLE